MTAPELIGPAQPAFKGNSRQLRQDVGIPLDGRRQRRVAHLLALAHHVNGKIRCGELRDYAHAAKVLGLTRARISQISGLTLLAPAIQEAILALPDTQPDPVTERQLREIVTEPLWEKQMRLWRLVRRHR